MFTITEPCSLHSSPDSNCSLSPCTEFTVSSHEFLNNWKYTFISCLCCSAFLKITYEFYVHNNHFKRFCLKQLDLQYQDYLSNRADVKHRWGLEWSSQRMKCKDVLMWLARGWIVVFICNILLFINLLYLLWHVAHSINLNVWVRHTTTQICLASNTIMKTSREKSVSLSQHCNVADRRQATFSRRAAQKRWTVTNTTCSTQLRVAPPCSGGGLLSFSEYVF